MYYNYSNQRSVTVEHRQTDKSLTQYRVQNQIRIKFVIYLMLEKAHAHRQIKGWIDLITSSGTLK